MKRQESILVKESIKEKDTTIENIYAHNLGEAQYIRQMLKAMKGKTDRKTVIVGDWKTPLTPVDRSCR